MSLLTQNFTSHFNVLIKFYFLNLEVHPTLKPLEKVSQQASDCARLIDQRYYKKLQIEDPEKFNLMVRELNKVGIINQY